MAEKELQFKSTKDINISKRIVDQVIGQDSAVEIIKKSAKQRRHVLLIGEPGTGKSMLGLALAELLPPEKLTDILAFPNPNDENQPLIRTVKAGEGRNLVMKSKLEGANMFKNQNIVMFILLILSMIAPWWVRSYYKSDVMFAAFFLGGMIFLASFVLFINLGQRMGGKKPQIPKVIVDNYAKKQAPFMDATGAHAGALLGDVLHDPFQSLGSSNNLEVVDGDYTNKSVNCRDLIDGIFDRSNGKIQKKKEKNYEAIHLLKNELFVLGETQGSSSPVEVLSSNRYDYDGKMIKLTTSENKELIVTPEHKIAISKNGQIAYVEARYIGKSDEVVSTSEDIIIDEQDIINTYDERQHELAQSYYDYLQLRKKNPSWGFKRIATKLGVSYGRTRWWWEKDKPPVPVQTVNFLKEKGLIPLKIDNPNLPLIAKILGATFGDGGIFETLNGIFLSSSEKEAVQEFGKDLEKLFYLKANENSRIIEGGEYGHSWCYQNTNRNVIRFFIALGAPKGNKSHLELKVPNWINLKNEFRRQYYGSYLGGEFGSPKIHVSKVHLNTFDIAITGSWRLEQNRIEFLLGLKNYLDENHVISSSIKTRKVDGNNVYLYRLLFSTKIDNMIRFIRTLKINYCSNKKEKLISIINEFMEIKRNRYYQLQDRGYGAEACMNLLKLSPNSLYEILNNKRFVLKKAET